MQANYPQHEYLKRDASQDAKDLYSSRVDIPYKNNQENGVTEFVTDNNHIDPRAHDRTVLQ